MNIDQKKPLESAMITLYDSETSGNCYKIRLMLSFLGLEYDRKRVDLFKEEQLAFSSLTGRAGGLPDRLN
jgi:hypothetical protein